MARVPHVVIRPVPGPGPPVVDLPLGIPPPGMLLAAGELACPAALLRQALDGRSLARCYVRAGQAQLLCLIALDTLPQDDAPSVYLSPADRDRLCPPGTDRLELEMVSDPPVVEYLRVTVDLPGPLGDPAAAGPAPRPAAVLSAGDLSPWPPGMPVPTGRVLPAHVLGHQLGLSFDALREQGSHRPLSVGVFGPGTRLFFALPPWLRVRGTQRMALLDTPSGPLFYMAEPLRSRLYPGVLFVADTTPLQHAEHEPYFVHAGRAFVVRTVALAEPPAQRTLFAHPDDLDSLFPPSRHPQLTFMPAPRPPALRMALLRLHASSGATLRPDIEATFLQHFTGVPLSLGQAISLPGLCGEVALLQDHEGNPLPAGAFTPEDVATGRAALLLQALVPRLPAVPAAVSLIDAGALLLLARVVISDRPRRGEALLSPGAMGLLRRKLAPPASSRLYFSRHREFFLLNSDDQAAEHEILLHSDSAAAIRWDDGEPLLFERTTRPRTLAELTLRMLGPESLGPVDVQAALAALSDLPLMLGETYAIPGPEGASLPARVERMRWPEDAQPAPLGRVAGAPATRVALLPSHAPGPPADVPLFYLHFDEPDVPLALAVDIQPMPSGASFPARARHQRLAGRTFVHPNTYRYIRMMAPHVTGVDIFLQVGQWFSILSPDENPRSTLAEGRVRLLDGGFPGLPSGRPWARAHIAAHAPAATTIECSIALADPQDQLLGRLNHEVIERDCFWSPHCSVLNVGQPFFIQLSRWLVVTPTSMVDQHMQPLTSAYLPSNATRDRSCRFRFSLRTDSSQGQPMTLSLIGDPRSALLRLPGPVGLTAAASPAPLRLFYEAAPAELGSMYQNDNGPHGHRGLMLLAPETYQLLEHHSALPRGSRHYVRLRNRAFLLRPGTADTCIPPVNGVHFDMEALPFGPGDPEFLLEYCTDIEEIVFAHIHVSMPGLSGKPCVHHQNLRELMLHCFSDGVPLQMGLEYNITTRHGQWTVSAAQLVATSDACTRAGVLSRERTSFHFQASHPPASMAILGNRPTVLLTSRRRAGFSLAAGLRLVPMPTLLYRGLRMPSCMLARLPGPASAGPRDPVFFRLAQHLFLARLSDAHDQDAEIQMSHHFAGLLPSEGIVTMEVVRPPPGVAIARVRVSPSVSGLQVEPLHLPRQDLVALFFGIFADQTLVQFERREVDFHGVKLVLSVEHMLGPDHREVACGVFHPANVQLLFRTLHQLVILLQ